MAWWSALNKGGHLSRDTAVAEAAMKGITFRAWRGNHYVTPAEPLIRLGSFGPDLTWRLEVEEKGLGRVRKVVGSLFCSWCVVMS
ncbi:hypothetical protein [Streptomyces sp. NPDC014805]|uniref:hypothetical protein n=1 Tax=Streptomyces sp. NPDC014805 TaxID=3364919 RepID=UPI0037004967